MVDKPFVPYIPAEKSIPEFTIKAVTLGIVLTLVMAAANTYLGLYAGMTVSASIPAAVISMGILRGILRRGTILENNIVQTIASAGQSVAAGVIFTIPAMVITGVWTEFDYWQTTLIALLGGVLGVLFMIPLRRALIVAQHGQLKYPEGTACAQVLMAGAGSPLTPALSPGERETGSPLVEEFERSDLVGWQAKILPLPKGEGRGEGERAVRTQPAPRRVGDSLKEQGAATLVSVIDSHATNTAKSQRRSAHGCPGLDRMHLRLGSLTRASDWCHHTHNFQARIGAQPSGCSRLNSEGRAETAGWPRQVPLFCSLKAALLCGRGTGEMCPPVAGSATGIGASLIIFVIKRPALGFVHIEY